MFEYLYAWWGTSTYWVSPGRSKPTDPNILKSTKFLPVSQEDIVKTLRALKPVQHRERSTFFEPMHPIASQIHRHFESANSPSSEEPCQSTQDTLQEAAHPYVVVHT